MFRIPRSQPWPPQIDLETVRETILYMKDDAKRVAGMEGVAKALETAIAEIEKAERALGPKRLTPIASRFLPRRSFEV